MIAKDPNPAGIEARLTEAAASGEPLEVIVVLRGRVERVPGTGRWRIRLRTRRVVTFEPESVIAVTPAPGRR